VGTLFQAALLPGITAGAACLMRSLMPWYALLNPEQAPAVPMGRNQCERITRGEVFYVVPWNARLPDRRRIFGATLVCGSQVDSVSSF